MVHRLLLAVGFLVVEQALGHVGSVVFFFFSFIFIGGELLYNIVVVFVIH